MRKVLLAVSGVMAMLMLTTFTVSAAPANGVFAGQLPPAHHLTTHVDYNWHHHNYRHRHWSHDHWHYYD